MLFFCVSQAVLTEYKLKAIEYVHGYFSSEQVLLCSTTSLSVVADCVLGNVCSPAGRGQNCFTLLLYLFRNLRSF